MANGTPCLEQQPNTTPVSDFPTLTLLAFSTALKTDAHLTIIFV